MWTFAWYYQWREGRAPSSGGPNSFNFMQFLGKFGKIICWRPWGVGAPSSGKSWICHWLYFLFGPCANPGPGPNLCEWVISQQWQIQDFPDVGTQPMSLGQKPINLFGMSLAPITYTNEVCWSVFCKTENLSSCMVYEEHTLLLFSRRSENSDWILQWWPMGKYILKYK